MNSIHNPPASQHLEVEPYFQNAMGVVFSTLNTKIKPCDNAQVYAQELKKINFFYKNQPNNYFSKSLSHLVHFAFSRNKTKINAHSVPSELYELWKDTAEAKDLRTQSYADLVSKNIAMGEYLFKKIKISPNERKPDLIGVDAIWKGLLDQLPDASARFNFVFFHELGHILQSLPFPSPHLQLSNQFSTIAPVEEINYLNWFKNMGSVVSPKEKKETSAENEKILTFFGASPYKKEVLSFFEKTFSMEEQLKMRYVIRNLKYLSMEMYADTMGVLLSCVASPQTGLDLIGKLINFRKITTSEHSVLSPSPDPTFAHDSVFALVELCEILNKNIQPHTLNLEELNTIATHCMTYGLLRYMKLLEETDFNYTKLFEFCANLDNVCAPTPSTLDLFGSPTETLTPLQKINQPVLPEHAKEAHICAFLYARVARLLALENPQFDKQCFTPLLPLENQIMLSLKSNLPDFENVQDNFNKSYGQSAATNYMTAAFIAKDIPFGSVQKAINKSYFLYSQQKTASVSLPHNSQLLLFPSNPSPAPALVVKNPIFKLSHFKSLLKTASHHFYYHKPRKIKI